MHIVSITLEQLEDKVMATMRVADEDEESFEVPPHMAGQLPMVMGMLKSQIAKFDYSEE